MEDVSGTGTTLTIASSITYPMGITISRWADDSDPFDVQESQLAEYGMGLNGDLVINRKPTGTELVVAVIPGTEEEIALSAIAEAARISKDKISYHEIITATINYPDGTSRVFKNGTIIAAPMATGISNNGRKKTKLFRFVFEGIVA